MTANTNVACHTPNGREIRDCGDHYEVQPHNDNYWISCRSVAEAMCRYHYPRGEPTARQIAELIVASWDSQWSIDETARIGVAKADAESAVEHADGDAELGERIVREIEAICRERASH